MSQIMWTDCDHAHTDEEEAVFRENNLSDYKITQTACKPYGTKGSYDT